MINLFKPSYNQEELDVFRLMLKSEIFKKLENEDLKHFYSYMYLRSYHQNEVVFFRNDPAQALYLIKEGVVALTLDFDEGEEEFSNLLNGSTFGDNTLLSGKKRHYTASIKSENAKIFVIPQDNILDIFERHPVLKAKVFENFAEAYHDYISKFFNIYRKSHGFMELGSIF